MDASIKLRIFMGENSNPEKGDRSQFNYLKLYIKYTLRLIWFNHNFFRQAPSQHVTLQVCCNGQLTITVVGNHFNPISFSQTHRQQSHFRTGPTSSFPDDKVFPGLGQAQRHQLYSVFQTAIADSVDFQFVLQHVKPLGSCDLDLQLLDPILFEFQYFSAFGADHMIMVLTQMPVFVKNHAIVKTALMGKSKTAHQLKGFVDEIPFQFPTVAFQQPYDILDGHVLFGLQESLQDFEPILEIVDVFLFEQLLELPLFLNVNLFHFSIKIRCPNRDKTE